MKKNTTHEGNLIDASIRIGDLENALIIAYHYIEACCPHVLSDGEGRVIQEQVDIINRNLAPF